MSKKFSKEEKQILIGRYLSGESVLSIIHDTNISRSTFYAWIKQHDIENENDKPKEFTLKNFRLLENKAERLEGMVKILKTAGCTATDSLSKRLIALERLHGQYSVHMLCDALDVSRGTFYNHIFRNKKDATTYAERRNELKVKIRDVFDDHNQILGAGKIAAVLKNEGCRVSSEMVLELMREMGLFSIRQNSKAMYLKDKRKMKDHINQNFHTDEPNQVWVSDVTYYRVKKNPFYICAIIDLFARKVIAHKISHTNSTQLVKFTFKQAYECRRPDSTLIFHSDRGGNYCSTTFCGYLKSLSVTQSFSPTGSPYHNAVIESFFASMKREELYRRKINSEGELRKIVDNHIVYHNTKRPHHTLKNKTPEQAELDFVDSNGICG